MTINKDDKINEISMRLKVAKSLLVIENLNNAFLPLDLRDTLTDLITRTIKEVDELRIR